MSGCGQGHLAQELCADLVAKATRPAMDTDDNVPARETKRCGCAIVGDRRHLLHFEVVVARTERAHLLSLALSRAMRYRLRSGSRDAAMLLDPVEVLGAAVALPDRPTRAAFEHAIHLDLVEHDLSRAAHTGGDRAEEAVRQCLFAGLQVLPLETRQQGADPAGDVEPDAAGRDDSSPIGVEGGHTADREAVAPMRVRHRIGS